MARALREPSRAWRVAKLAQAASVSLGPVSNVRFCLLDQEWAQVSRNGLLLSDPDALLDAWREAYELPAGKRHSFYTTLHGTAFERPCASWGQCLMLDQRRWRRSRQASGSRPRPHRNPVFLCDAAGLDRLSSLLKLCSASKGENVAVTVLEDLGVFRRVMVTRPSTSSSIS